MKKILYFIITILIISLISYGLYINKQSILNLFTENKLDEGLINTINNEGKKLSKEEIDEKMDILKQRSKVKDLLSRGDNYFLNDQLTLALVKYNQALSKNPKDELIIKKIAYTYFEMKNFKDAAIYFKQLLSDEEGEKKYILSLLYNTNLSKKEDRNNLKEIIKTDIKDKEKVFFYTTTIDCIEDFHVCKKSLEEKTRSGDLKSKEMIEIKKVIDNYISFGLTDLYYKNALVIGNFMKQELFPIVIKLGENILKEKPDYRTIIQIMAQSYYELGDYKNSNKYLKDYFNIDKNDPIAAYMLGVINLKLKEYILSNIYLNKALDLNYKDKINVKRKLVYNYYILENYEKMYKIFDEMLRNEKNLTSDDVSPIIIFAIEKGETEKAYIWTKIATNKFPKDPTYYAYMAKFEREKGFLDKALENALSGALIDNQNQFINQELALIKISENDLNKAKEILNKIIDKDDKTEFSKKAKEEIDKINSGFYSK